MTEIASPPPVQTDEPAQAPAPLKPRRRGGNLLRDALEVILIAVVLYLIIWNALQTVRVDGTSMVGTLQDQDLLLASKVSYYFGGNPQRGDIVILIPPNDSSRDFIKRVIGLPGDIIEIDGSKPSPQILIKPSGQGDFQVLKEPYLPQQWTTSDFCCRNDGTASATAQPVKIPNNDYFVMGDNRNFSSDSRSFGFVPRDNIKAKAFLRLWPLNHFGGLGDGPSLAAPSTAVIIVPVGAIALLEWQRRRSRTRTAIRASRLARSPTRKAPRD